MSIYTTPTKEQQLELVIQRKLNGLNVCKPCKVVAVHDGKTVDVRVLDKLKIEVGGNTEYIDMPLLYNVPVLFFRVQSKGFGITLPVQANDTGLLVFSDKNLQGFLLGNGEDNMPVDEGSGTSIRQHSLTDGMYIPMLCHNGNNFGVIESDCIDIRDETGETHVRVYDKKIDVNTAESNIEMLPESIKITRVDANIELNDAAVTIMKGGSSVVVSSGGMVVTSGSSGGVSMGIEGDTVTIQGNINISGDVVCSNIQASGNIQADGTVHGSNI